MISVKDLTDKLLQYIAQHPDNGKKEVMLKYDGDIAFAFLSADNNTAMGDSVMKHYLVFIPDLHGDRLMLRRKEIDIKH